jgi:hypothetical protein
MKLINKPIDHVVKQLQSKRFHLKRQDNKKKYNRDRSKQLFIKGLL